MQSGVHTFVLEPATWIATGHFTGQSGEPNAASGEAVISHDKKVWRNRGRMRIEADPVLELANVYDIVPFPHQSPWTCWTSHNAGLGRLIGRFILMPDTIMSIFESEDGAYNGSETMLRLGPDTYRCRGALLRGGVLVSHWSLELKRRE
jgi:hypothetical protein